MTLLMGSLTIGAILAVMAVGVYITFRIHSFPDITMEGSFVFGASVATVLIVEGVNPWVACLAASICGAGAGLVTGVLHTKFKFNGLLSGILVMTALYSINLRVMGRSNLPLSRESVTVFSQATSLWSRALDKNASANIAVGEHDVSLSDAAALAGALFLATSLVILVHVFFKTEFGVAMRARGDNEQMVRALGVNANLMLVLGLMLSNGLIAFSGSLFAQYQGFSDVQMGLGMLVWGLASVIIGEALVRSNALGYVLIGCVMGAILFRLLVALALRCGLNPNDLKLITAVFVFAALALPGMLRRIRFKSKRAAKAT